jgi:Gpi18-like mannosyltransferase
MAFYALLTILAFAKNKPIWGAFAFSLSLSIKAGALLVLPAFAGLV